MNFPPFAHLDLLSGAVTQGRTGPATLLITAWLVLICAAVPAALFAVNVWLFRRPGRVWNRRVLPPISVLIPARNEEHSIGVAIASVLASRGVDIELIVLDDDSTDGTGALVRAAAEGDSRVRLEAAPPLPAGWNGKQHACWVLAGLATRDVFCFLDADVRVGPEALYLMVSELNHVQGEDAETALVSGFPRQETETFLEWLLLPLIHFVLLGFLPLPAERWTARSGFAAGCGQFMMVRREAYLASGGHAAIRTTMHDGLLLPQLLRRNGFRTRVYDLSRDAVCRMYRSGSEVWHGLAKNATEGMASPGRIPVFSLLLIFGQVLPAVVAVWAWIQQDTAAFTVSMLALELGYAIRLVSAWRYRQSWRGAALHPLGILVLLALQWYALMGKLTHRQATWKQRSYQVD
jgi:glycosyltransferase involved in cell wall biosynthesis